MLDLKDCQIERAAYGHTPDINNSDKRADDYDADEYESENIFPDWESGSDDYPTADMHYEYGKSKFDPY